MDDPHKTLVEMFKMQFNFQLKFNEHSIGSQEYINEMALALIAEIMEAVNETAWKPWKMNQTTDTEKFKEELIDCWKFMINLTMASGMDIQELFDRFKKKHEIIVKRQQEKN